MEEHKQIYEHKLRKVHGPYIHSDGSGRKFVVLMFENGSRKHTAYARFLLEQHIGRMIAPGYEVDHKDRDPTNDSLDNLQILEKSHHAIVDAIRIAPRKTKCGWCKLNIYLTAKQQSDKMSNSKRNGQRTKLSFCDKSCAGKYNAAVRSGKIVRDMSDTEGDTEYFQLEK